MREGFTTGGSNQQNLQMIETVLDQKTSSEVVEDQSQEGEETPEKELTSQSATGHRCQHCFAMCRTLFNIHCNSCQLYQKRNGVPRPLGDICEKCGIAKIPTTGWWPGGNRRSISANGAPTQCLECFKVSNPTLIQGKNGKLKWKPKSPDPVPEAA